MSHTPKFEIGQVVMYIHINAGHDPEWLMNKGAKITQVYKGDTPKDTCYKLEGSHSLHPETRLKTDRYGNQSRMP